MSESMEIFLILYVMFNAMFFTMTLCRQESILRHLIKEKKLFPIYIPILTVITLPAAILYEIILVIFYCLTWKPSKSKPRIR